MELGSESENKAISLPNPADLRPGHEDWIPFIFVGGAKRSGTTLVQRLISAHSAVTGGPEFNFSDDIFFLYRNMKKMVGYRNNDFFFDQAGLDQAFLDFYYHFFYREWKASGARFFAEKTPTNIFAAQYLLDFFPDAKYVNIIRDGRDVVLSHQEVKKRHAEQGYTKETLKLFSIARVSREWNLAVDAWEKLASQERNKGRIHNILYPELILKPKETLTRLFEFLELDLEPHLLDPQGINNEATVVNDRWHVKDTHFQGWNPNKIDKWKKGLSAMQKFRANLFMSRNLKQMGFEVKGIFTGLHQLKKLAPYALKARLTGGK